MPACITRKKRKMTEIIIIIKENEKKSNSGREEEAQKGDRGTEGNETKNINGHTSEETITW